MPAIAEKKKSLRQRAVILTAAFGAVALVAIFLRTRPRGALAIPAKATSFELQRWSTGTDPGSRQLESKRPLKRERLSEILSIFQNSGHSGRYAYCVFPIVVRAVDAEGQTCRYYGFMPNQSGHIEGVTEHEAFGPQSYWITGLHELRVIDHRADVDRLLADQQQ